MIDDIIPIDDGPLSEDEIGNLTLLRDEGLDLLRSYRAIADVEVRRSILGVVKAMAASPLGTKEP